MFSFQFDLANWSSERSHTDRRCCNWTFVFDPSGRLVYYWSVVVSLAFLYNFWVNNNKIRVLTHTFLFQVIIYRTAFDEIQASTVLIWFSLDYLADFIYLMDILIHFRTGISYKILWDAQGVLKNYLSPSVLDVTLKPKQKENTFRNFFHICTKNAYIWGNFPALKKSITNSNVYFDRNLSSIEGHLSSK